MLLRAHMTLAKTAFIVTRQCCCYCGKCIRSASFVLPFFPSHLMSFKTRIYDGSSKITKLTRKNIAIMISYISIKDVLGYLTVWFSENIDVIVVVRSLQKEEYEP